MARKSSTTVTSLDLGPRGLARRAPERPRTALAGEAASTAELTRSQEALRESERHYRQLVQALPMAVYATDQEGRVLLYNEAAVALWGREPAIGEDRWCGSLKMYRPDGASLPREECPMAVALQEGRSVGGVEAVVERPDGSRRDVLAHPVLLRDSAGTLVGAINVLVDITERKQAQERERRMEERLREKQRLEGVGLLAGGIAHDFNNILVGVLGNASLAGDMLPDDSPVKPLLKGIETAGERAAHLTRQMLAYAGKGQFIIEPVDLSEVARETVSLVRPSISKRIAVRLDLASRLPAIEADRSQVQQVIMNLVLNAAEAIGDKAGSVTVRTSLERLGENEFHSELGADLTPGMYAAVEVRDTGCGMDRETRSRMFDPFFTTKFTGRGLGLAAVAGVVRGHNGAVRVTSRPRRGTAFTVLFPATEAMASLEVRGIPEQQELRGYGSILVVDDEPVVLEMANSALERQGYRVLLANSGQAAIEIFRQEASAIDLVLLDLSLPGMSGHETLIELQKQKPDVRALVSSGYSEAEAFRQFSGQKVCGFVQKPYTAAVLAERIKSTLRSA